MMRHSIAVLIFLASAAAVLASLPARAAEVSLIGTFGATAAILSVGGGAPKTVKVGQSYGGVTLVSVGNDSAVVEADGKRRTLQRGQTYSSGAGSGAQTVTLAAGAGGHFSVDGQINGGAIRFLVDTGATAVSIPAADAVRLRIDYRKGRRATTQTAAGPTTAYLVTLDSVRIGGVELQNVEGIVIEQGLPIALLGNSFLNRMEMRRDGETMTLTRRY